MSSQVMKCYVVAPNICGSYVLNLCYITFLAPRILWWLIDLWKNLYTSDVILYEKVMDMYLYMCFLSSGR